MASVRLSARRARPKQARATVSPAMTALPIAWVTSVRASLSPSNRFVVSDSTNDRSELTWLLLLMIEASRAGVATRFRRCDMFVTSRRQTGGLRVIEANRWLTELEARLRALRERSDPEDVHQLRVATRRLATWLRLAGLHVLRDDLRWLRRVAGAVRDIDVVLDIEGDPTWTRWLRSERRVQHQALMTALASDRTGGLLLALRSLPAVTRDQARARLKRLAGRALEAGDELEAAPDEPERFHHLRRKVRTLRYGLEWLDEKTGAFREFQEVSGLAADRALSLRLMAVYPQFEELAARRGQLESEYAQRRHAAFEAWAGLRERVQEMTR